MSKHDTPTTSDSHAQIESLDAPTRKRNQCRGCGREIDSELARVIGDNQGCIPACEQCSAITTESKTLTSATVHNHRRQSGLGGSDGAAVFFQDTADAEEDDQ